ncbi:MAG: hypothetical protein AAGA24_01150 [Pseudomonadota bacterium]
MLVYQLIAAAFLFASAALLFGPQLVIYGPRAVPALIKTPQVRFAGGAIVTVAVLAFVGPQLLLAMLEGGQTISIVAMKFVGVSFA